MVAFTMLYLQIYIYIVYRLLISGHQAFEVYNLAWRQQRDGADDVSRDSNPFLQVSASTTKQLGFFFTINILPHLILFVDILAPVHFFARPSN